MRKRSDSPLLFLALVVTISSIACWAVSCRESAKPVSEPVSLTIAINAGDEGRAIAALVKTYKLPVRVVELPYNDLRQKLSLTLAAPRSPYDIVMLDDPWFPELSSKLEPLDPLPQDLVNDIIPASLYLGRDPYRSGAQKALPFVGNCQLLFYRTDILLKAGVVAVPQSWRNVLTSAATVHEKTAAFGYCIRGKAGAPVVTDFLPVLWSSGGDIFDDPGKPERITVNSPQARRACDIYSQLAKLSPSGAAAFDWTEMTTAFSAGQVAMELNWPAAVATIDPAIPRAADGSRVWGVAMPPRDTTTDRATSMAGNWLLSVPNKAAHAQEAKELILWLMDHQAAAAMKGNPPTRRSVYRELEAQNIDALFYLPTLEKALDSSTPRPRTPKWNAVEDAISNAITTLITQHHPADQVVTELSADIKRAME